jgi:hypothetical protein
MTENLWVCTECKWSNPCYCNTYDVEKYPPICSKKKDFAKWRKWKK